MLKLPLHEGLFAVGELWIKYLLPAQRSMWKLVITVSVAVILVALVLFQTVGTIVSRELKSVEWEHGALYKECIAEYGVPEFKY